MNDSDRLLALRRLRRSVLTCLFHADQLRLHRLGITLDQARVAIDLELEQHEEALGPETILG